MTAYLFPGQGAQFTGMGAKLRAESPLAQALAEEADAILGFELSRLMAEGSEEELRQTRVTQPAIFLHSILVWQSKSLSVQAEDVVGGHSLGEFSALVACGALAWQDALRLVYERAQAMQAACEQNPGSMAAVMHPDFSLIEGVCAELQAQGQIVVAANYNNPGQLVISGALSALELAIEALKAKGAKAIPLSVGGAFHSPLMQPAQDRLQQAILGTTFSAPRCAIYQNVSAQAEREVETIRQNLITQLTAPVRWQQSLENMLAAGISEFVEVGGKGNILLGMLKKINRQAAGQCLSE